MTRGRPTLPPEQRKPATAPVSIRLTTSERAELKRRGVRRGPNSLCAWLAEKPPDQPGGSATQAQEENRDSTPPEAT